MEEEVLFDRSLEDVTGMISHAKLIQSDLLPLSQVVSFKSEMVGEEVKLMEVTKDLASYLKTGDVLTIRGEDAENAVICSKDRTYDIKEAETSNSLMFLDKIVFPDSIDKTSSERSLGWSEVGGVFHKYLEIIEIRPKLRKIKETLSQNLYNEDTRRDNKKGMTNNELLDIIQASEEELLKGLKQYECVQVDGMWFILDQDYQMMVLSRILKFFDENSWKLDCVHKKETVSTLSSLVSDQVLDQVFDIYCDPMEGGEEDEFSVNKEKVSRFFGDFLLATISGYVLEEFLEMWQKAVPDGIKTDLDHLSGLVLVDRDQSPPVIKRFTEDSLPVNIQDRLNVLFNARERWTLTEISPFVEPLTTNKLNVNALLTKYARPLNISGVKYFCAKHGK